MRQAYQDYKFLVLDDVFIGVSLGYDFCAEHEWGIKGIKNGLGIPKMTRKNMGVKCRTITMAPMDDFQYREIDDYTYLVYSSNASRWSAKKFSEDKLCDYGYDYKSPELFNKTGILTAWSERAFSIIGKGDEPRNRLKELYTNFKKKNIVITYLGSNNPFANNSLSILITNKIPQEMLEQMLEVDTHQFDLKDTIKKLNLEGKARANGMDFNHFHAISPRFIKYGATPQELEKEKQKNGFDTKYDVEVWVNGTGGNQSGWFTVEDVLEWISHKGTKPISDSSKSKKATKISVKQNGRKKQK